VSWPSDDEWDGYGLKGLKQPAGSTVTNVAMLQGVYFVSMVDAGKDAYTDMIAQIKKLTGASRPYSLIKSENGEMSEYQFADHNVQLVVDYVDRELVIRALR
jgi:flagellar motor component MotA